MQDSLTAAPQAPRTGGPSHRRPSGGRPPGARRPRFWLRWLGLITGLVVILALVPAGGALTMSGHDSFSARYAEWARGHGLGWFVTTAEKVQYSLNKPKTGGRPADLPSAGPNALPRIPSYTPPPALAPLATGGALAGEGQWTPQAVDSNGRPVLLTTVLRPDAVHTSYLAGIARLDVTRLQFQLHPGTSEPGGGPWPVASSITPAPGLLAAFNMGFRLQDTPGGWWLDGKAAKPLHNGDAAFTINAQGRPDVITWGSGLTPPPGIVAVRQNLVLLVDHGVVNPTAAAGGVQWGATIGNKAFVWRSGVGVTADGSLIYVAGNALSVQTLGNLLADAGAVRAMELDINPQWTSFVRYPQLADGTPGPAVNLTPDMQRSAKRYETASSRDFITASLAPGR